jgi:hypothetical protein
MNPSESKKNRVVGAELQKRDEENLHYQLAWEKCFDVVVDQQFNMTIFGGVSFSASLASSSLLVFKSI